MLIFGDDVIYQLEYAKYCVTECPLVDKLCNINIYNMVKG